MTDPTGWPPLPADATAAARGARLEDLADWVFSGPEPAGRDPEGGAAATRLRDLLDRLDAAPSTRSRLHHEFTSFFLGVRFTHLLTDTGLPSEAGFVAELWERVLARVLPEPPPDRDADRLLRRILRDEDRVRWLLALDRPLRARLVERLLGSDACFAVVRAAAGDAAWLLGVRVADTGTAAALRRHCLDAPLADSPFLSLPAAIREVLLPDAPPEHREAQRAAIHGLVTRCRAELAAVEASFDLTGISPNVVYQLDAIRHRLDRLAVLLPLIAPRPGDDDADAGWALVAPLLRGSLRDRSVADFVRGNTRLLAKRVIERAGHAGEHYITHSSVGLHRMVTSAAGGGALTAIAAVARVMLKDLHLPVLLAAGAIAGNYAFFFLLMQGFGFTLATKQPSMTAAALAHSIVTTGDRPELGPLVEQVVRTVRTQLAALAGNLGAVVPVTVGLDLLWRSLTGASVLSAAAATEVFAQTAPLTSGTLPFAALTGVLLWSASVIGGAVENEFLVRRLPDALRSNRRLQAWVGVRGAARVSAWCAANVSAAAGNLGFAALLAGVPMTLALVGLTVEVRHVTFVAASLTLAGMHRGAMDLLQADVAWALVGLGLVGVLNFVVSFTLALFVAFRARDVDAGRQLELLRAVFARVRRAPWDLVRAPPSP